MEKISKKHIRKEKIDKLKYIGLQEIEKTKLEICEKLNVDLFNNERDKYDTLAFNYYCLIMLENYLKNECSLWEIVDIQPEFDSVFYTINLMTIDIWMEKGVVNKYLYYMEDTFEACHILTDDFFGCRSNFISIFESVLYKQKLKEQNNNENE